MSEQSYIGIDTTENNEWVAALWTEGKVILSRPFRNTSSELSALVRFISGHFVRPRICLKPSSPATLKLIKYVGGIPDVEVVCSPRWAANAASLVAERRSLTFGTRSLSGTSAGLLRGTDDLSLHQTTRERNMLCWFSECKKAIQWGNDLGAELFKSKNLAYLVLLASIVTLVIGLALFVIDPNVRSPLDGIWSAWVTMTHVGFGDVVPVSFFGRLLAAALILVGLALFSIFTAIVSVTLIGRNMETLGSGLSRIVQETASIESGEERILAELARLHERLMNLEKQMEKRALQ